MRKALNNYSYLFKKDLDLKIEKNKEKAIRKFWRRIIKRTLSFEILNIKYLLKKLKPDEILLYINEKLASNFLYITNICNLVKDR